MAVRLGIATVGLAMALLLTDGVQCSMDVHMDKRQARPGDTIELVCDWSDLDDDPSPGNVKWKFNDKRIDDKGPSRYRIMTNIPSSKSELRIANINRLDQGNYTCVVKEDHIHWSEFMLDLHLPPEMRVEPDRRPFLYKETTIHCFMEGKPHANLTWWFETMGEKFSSKDYTDHFSSTEVKLDRNETGSFLTITFKPNNHQSGYYKCKADDENVYFIMLKVRGIDIKCLPEVAEVSQEDDASFKCNIINWPSTYTQKSLVWQAIQPGNRIISTDHKFFTYFRQQTMDWAAETGLVIRSVNEKDFGSTYQIDASVTTGMGINSETWSASATVTLEKATVCRTCQAEYLQCNDINHCACPEGLTRSKAANLSSPVCVEDLSRPPGPNKLRGRGDKPGPESEENDKDERRGDKDKVVVVNHVSVALVVGVTMGALGVLLVVIVAYVCWRKRRKAKKKKNRFDPNYIYQYEYHGEANTHTFNPSFVNHGYQLPPPKEPVRKLNTYVSDIEKEQLEFPRDKLQLGVDLGEGRFGKVIQARAMNITGSGNWVQVAVKTCRATATDSEKQDLYQELEIMRKIPPHPNIVTLYGCCSKKDPLYIIIEYVQRGSMLDYLRKCRPMSRMSRESVMSNNSIMSDSTIMSGSTLMSHGSLISSGTRGTSSFMQPRAKDLTIFALQIARGMAHLTNCGIIHRDLAARNILLGTDFSCKICDFGLARDVEGVDVYERTSKGPLPIRWMSPESLHENMYTMKSDVWSYGILLWEIVTLGATPYQGKSANEVMRQVLQGVYLPQPLHCREEMYDLMVKCWEKADLRPTFAEIVNHFEALMDDDYIILSEYDENDYQWLDSYTMEERV